MSQALYRKWRPQTWSDVMGQDHITQTLRNAIQSNRVVHAYLFAGPRGTGKTSTARLLAKAINCLEEDIAQRPCNRCATCQAVNNGRFLDLIEIDAASNTSVDDVRDLRDKINFSPSQGKFKVYIIDEVHMLSTAAFNALLKTLEEPPPHAIFVLATTEIHKIPATVLSRCQRHEFRRIAVNDIVTQLNEIIAAEEIKIEPAAVSLIARQSTGAMRDAISLLDQLASSADEITLDFAHRVLGTATSQSVIQLAEALQKRQTAEGLQYIHIALDSGTDPRQYARQVVEYLRSVLLAHMGNTTGIDVPAETRSQIEKHAQLFSQDYLLFCLQRFNSTAADTRSNWQPGLPLELAFAECVDYSSPEIASQGLVKTEVLPPGDRGQTEPYEHQKPAPKNAPKPTEIQDWVPPQIEAPLKQIDQEKTALVPQSDENTAVAESEKIGKFNLKSIRQQWDEIRRQVKNERPQTEALLNSCKSIAVKNGELVLGFASEVVKSKMDTKDNLALVTPIISRLVGEEVVIRCVVINKKITGSIDASLDGDGMVNAALGLGGQIVQQE